MTVKCDMFEVKRSILYFANCSNSGFRLIRQKCVISIKSIHQVFMKNRKIVKNRKKLLWCSCIQNTLSTS